MTPAAVPGDTDRSRPDRAPARILIIQLVPTPTLRHLLRQLRERWPAARLCVLTASPEGERDRTSEADEVLVTAGLGAREVVRRARAVAPEVTIVAGGADYGLGPTYAKAVLLARLSGARRRWQWEPGEEPGRAVQTAAAAAFARVGRRKWARTGGAAWEAAARPRRRRSYRRSPTHGPRVVQIAITEACNYHCLMCGCHNPEVEGRHVESERPRLSPEAFTHLVRDLRRSGAQTIGLTGSGDPLTHPQAIDMIGAALQLGLQVIPTTNGSLLTEERLRRLVDLGLRRLHVSLNAGTDDTYARLHPGTPPGRLAEIVARLRGMADYANAKGRRVELQASAVLTRLNMGELPELVQRAREARAEALALLLMEPVEGQPDLQPRAEDWPALRQSIREARGLAAQLGVHLLPWDLEETAQRPTRSVYERVPCYTGYEFAQITANGDVLFCAHCLTPLGNVHESSFDAVWTSPLYQRARETALALPTSREQPAGCACFQGCCHVAANLEVHRRLHGDRAITAL